MGNPRALYHACAVAAGLLLTACDDAPQRWRESEIRDIVRQEAPAPYGGPASGDDLATLQGEVSALRADLDALRNTVNDNADSANDNRDITNHNLEILQARADEIYARLGM